MIQSSMKKRFAIPSLAVALLLSIGCASQMKNDPDAPTGPPSATLSVETVQASYYGSASTGHGRIHYKGATRDFSIASAGAGGAGAQSISAVGQVYNLNSLADFPGTYTGLRSGLTLFNGKMYERLKNEKGAVIYLTGKTKGLSTSSGLDKVVITLK